MENRISFYVLHSRGNKKIYLVWGDIDLEGKIFGRLEVISVTDPYIAPSGVKMKRWLCLCSCGNYSKVITSALKKIKSCGCLQKEKAAAACLRNFSKTEDKVLSNKNIVNRGFTSDCWEWAGQPHHSGYASTTFKGKYTSLHRLSYKYYKEEIPSGMEVCHLCHNRLCFNPDHLVLGTHKENMEMSAGKGTLGTPKEINEDIARKIKHMLSEGATNKEISESLPVSYTIVVDIKRGRSWRHV